MNWKSILTANLLILFLSLNLNAQNRYEGIQDPPSANIYWKNYNEDIKKKLTQEIKDALSLSLTHLSLFEYSFVLEELLQAYHNEGFKEEWKQYADSLETTAGKELIGAGLIPLQAQFFHATLQANPQYKNQYPEAYTFLQQSTRKMEGMGYQTEEYEQVLEQYAFSDIVGEGIMMDFLMLEDVKLLEVIEQNASLQSRYQLWVENLTDPANNFRFNEYRPREIFTRKLFYLVVKLQNSDNILAKSSWPQIKEIRTSRIRKPSPDSFFNQLTGTWEGTYDEKGRQIRIYLVPLSNRKDETQVKGHNKFVYQSDIKQIAMRGTFEDKGGYYHVKMEEYKVPFEEEPQWKQDAINEDWGGPEKFYPNELSYGLFDLKIDKETKEMTGTWSSKSGKIVREFTIPKTGN
ncbi:MAG: hypothetical protein MI921_11010 [Cytophagales bacterium]|nr:hypothetical protein [Cytophagales bacterium]